MARPTLQSGDIWQDNLANAAGFPQLDGTDEYGHGPKVPDEWLSDASEHIKSRFYAWLNRVQVSQGTGLTVTYTGATVRLENGSTVSLSAGSLTLPDNAAVYVYISDAGTVTQSSALPSKGVALAYAVTVGGAVSSLTDLRYQAVEQVGPLAVADAAGFRIGDIKETARAAPDIGYVRCDWALYEDIDYPLAAGVIGRQYSKPGDAAGTFRVPPLAGRFVLGVGSGAGLTSRSSGDMGGVEAVRMTEATMFPHDHTTTELAHSHTGADSGHVHDANDSGHVHPLLGSLVGNGTQSESIITENAAVAGDTRGGFGYAAVNRKGQELIQRTKTGLSILLGKANINISATKTNLTIDKKGGGQPLPTMPPFVAMHKYIRLF